MLRAMRFPLAERDAVDRVTREERHGDDTVTSDVRSI